MTISFQPAKSREDFETTLTAIKEKTAEKDVVLDETLNPVSKSSLGFMIRAIMQPVAALFGYDTMSIYRVSHVAASVLQYVEANNQFADQALKEKAVEIITALNDKTAQKYEGAITAHKLAIEKVEPKPAEPEPQPQAVAEPAAAPAPAASSSSAAAEQVEIPAQELQEANAELATEAFRMTNILHANDVKGFSPIALSQLLGLWTLGSDDETKAKIKETVLKHAGDKSYDVALQQQRQRLEKAGIEQKTFIIHNRGNWSVKPEFTTTAENLYGAKVVEWTRGNSARLKTNSAVKEFTGKEELFGDSFATGKTNESKIAFAFLTALKLSPTLPKCALETVTEDSGQTYLKAGKIAVKRAENADFALTEIEYEGKELSKVFVTNKGVKEPSIEELNALRAQAKEETKTVLMPKLDFASAFDLKEKLETSGFPKGQVAGLDVTGFMSHAAISEQEGEKEEAVEGGEALDLRNTHHTFIMQKELAVLSL